MRYTVFILVVFLTACDLVSSDPNEVNYRKIVDKKAKFIGKGIKVPQADKEWNWLLPDLNSTAQKSSHVYKKPAGSSGAKYLRSFKLYDNIGFVWSWQHQDLEVFLIYTFMGTNGYTIRTVHNTHNISVDEAILAVFFDSEFSAYLQAFEVRKWQIHGVDDDYEIESLGFLGQEMFSQSVGFELFEGRIITLPWTFVKYENQQYHLCDRYYSSNPCYLLPSNFEDLIKQKSILQEVQVNNSLRFLLKVRFGKNKQISDILAGNIIRENIDESLEVIAQWPVPEPYLGAESQPFYLNID